jgi:hypothetical protein
MHPVFNTEESERFIADIEFKKVGEETFNTASYEIKIGNMFSIKLPSHFVDEMRRGKTKIKLDGQNYKFTTLPDGKIEIQFSLLGSVFISENK